MHLDGSSDLVAEHVEVGVAVRRPLATHILLRPATISKKQRGMGVVYKAEDIRLYWPVALKCLPPPLAHGAISIQRFRREAETASAINHGNICTIHDIGDANGQAFAVMEVLDGITLKQIIAGRAVEIGTLLEVAIQVAL